MNTQTHLLLACTVLIPASRNIAHGVSRPGLVALTLAVIAGAVVPDVSIVVMWGIAKLNGVADAVIWDEWYYSPYWQMIGAIANSFPVYFALAVVAWLAGGRYRYSMSGITPPALQRQVPRPSSRLQYPAELMLAFASAAILHLLADLPLHHDDGHPHFWPFSMWIFSSPVSYWDSAHYGRSWSFIEMVLALALVGVLWRRISHWLIKALLILTGLSGVVISGIWLLMF